MLIFRSIFSYKKMGIFVNKWRKGIFRKTEYKE